LVLLHSDPTGLSEAATPNKPLAKDALASGFFLVLTTSKQQDTSRLSTTLVAKHQSLKLCAHRESAEKQYEYHSRATEKKPMVMAQPSL
jgi:hypothetical protein